MESESVAWSRRTSDGVGERRVESEKAGEYNRTTSMLVAVVLCFVVTEMPQGVLAFLSGVDERIFDAVYTQLGDVWDIVVLINSSVNFLLYCTMSRQFRGTFWELFVAPLRCRCASAAATAEDGQCTADALPQQQTAVIPARRIQCRNATSV